MDTSTKLPFHLLHFIYFSFKYLNTFVVPGHLFPTITLKVPSSSVEDLPLLMYCILLSHCGL